MDSPWMTSDEAVKYLRLDIYKHGREILHRMCRDKRLHCKKIGRWYRFKSEWLDAAMEVNPR